MSWLSQLKPNALSLRFKLFCGIVSTDEQLRLSASYGAVEEVELLLDRTHISHLKRTWKKVNARVRDIEEKELEAVAKKTGEDISEISWEDDDNTAAVRRSSKANQWKDEYLAWEIEESNKTSRAIFKLLTLKIKKDDPEYNFPNACNMLSEVLSKDL